MLSPVALPDWEREIKRSWIDFDYAPPGGESSRVAQARIAGVLTRVRRDHAIGTVLLASHGNLISLALNALEPRIGFDFWKTMPMPAVYRLEWTAGEWRIVSGPNLRSP